jgi:transcription-repair coupling factor (superfamily II helicase)
VPRPQSAGFPVRPVAGVALLEWARGVIDEVIAPPAPASQTAATTAATTGSDS